MTSDSVPIVAGLGHDVPVLELRGVTRSFSSRTRTTVALDQVNLAVYSGSSVGIVGESGAGNPQSSSCSWG